jgi:broad specificity phosphatase PhoE
VCAEQESPKPSPSLAVATTRRDAVQAQHLRQLLGSNIERASAMRGDSAQQTADLLAEVLALEPRAQQDMAAHFTELLALWSKATGQPELPDSSTRRTRGNF